MSEQAPEQVVLYARALLAADLPSSPLTDAPEEVEEEAALALAEAIVRLGAGGRDISLHALAASAVSSLLDQERAYPERLLSDARVAVALRGVRRLLTPGLDRPLCAVLVDYTRGLWDPWLTRATRNRIREGLARTLPLLDPGGLTALWELRREPDERTQAALRVGLDMLTSAHAIDHILIGLERCEDHLTRAELVARLEQVADPAALPLLVTLRRQSAHDDWTLSRQIHRAIRVIEHQNRGMNHRTLLRPSPSSGDDELLRTPEDGGGALLLPRNPAPGRRP